MPCLCTLLRGAVSVTFPEVRLRCHSIDLSAVCRTRWSRIRRAVLPSMTCPRRSSLSDSARFRRTRPPRSHLIHLTISHSTCHFFSSVLAVLGNGSWPEASVGTRDRRRMAWHMRFPSGLMVSTRFPIREAEKQKRRSTSHSRTRTALSPLPLQDEHPLL